MTQSKVTKEKKDKDLPPTKVVIRRLPPSLTKEEFLEQISPVPEHDYYQFVGPDKSLGQNAFCRAYINFVNHEDISIFCEKFDGYVFVDSRGNEYPAVVEYAPFQKVPKKKKRTDTKKGTIEQDADYIKFLEQLKNPEVEPAPPIEKYIEEIETRERECKANHGVLKVSTPLLDYLKKRKDEKRAARQRAIEERKRREAERRKQKEEERRKRREKEKEQQLREKDTKKEKKTEEGEGKVKILKKTENRRDSDGEPTKENSKHGSSSREGKYGDDDHRETKSPTKEDRYKSSREREKDWGKRDREPRRRGDREYKDSKETKYSGREKGSSREAESRGGSYRREKREDRREWDERKEKEKDKEKERDRDRKRDKDYDREQQRRDREEHRREREDRRDRDYDREHHYERERREYTGRFASGRDSKPRKVSSAEQKEKTSGVKSDVKHGAEKGGGDVAAEAGKNSNTSEKDSSSPKKDNKPARFSAMRAKEKEAREDSRTSKEDKDKAEAASGDSTKPARRVRNKDRPERAIYVPGRRAAEKRKEEEKKKELEGKGKETEKSAGSSSAKDAEN